MFVVVLVFVIVAIVVLVLALVAVVVVGVGVVVPVVTPPTADPVVTLEQKIGHLIFWRTFPTVQFLVWQIKLRWVFRFFTPPQKRLQPGLLTMALHPGSSRYTHMSYVPSVVFSTTDRGPL